MTVLKGRDIDRHLSKPDPAIAGTLIFGPEEGLVSERAEMLLGAYVSAGAESVRISADSYRSGGEHIEQLLKTDSLFAASQVFYLEDAGAELAKHLKEADEEVISGTAHRFIIIAGDLKKTSPLRTLAEKSSHMAAIPCYVEGQGERLTYVSSLLEEAGLSISGEDRTYLISLLSENRLVNRGELDKLILYATGQDRIEREDIDAVLGDVGMSRVEEVIDLAMGGQRPKLSAELMRFAHMGIAEEMIFAMLSRHVEQLYGAKIAEARGMVGEEALRAGFGYVHFSRRSALLSQLRLWSLKGLESALSSLPELELALRLQTDLKQQQLERFLLRLATLARL